MSYPCSTIGFWYSNMELGNVISKIKITDDFCSHEIIWCSCQPCANQVIHLSSGISTGNTSYFSCAKILIFSSSSLHFSFPPLLCLQPHKEIRCLSVSLCPPGQFLCDSPSLSALLLPWDSAEWRLVCSWQLLALPFTSSWMDLHSLDC